MFCIIPYDKVDYNNIFISNIHIPLSNNYLDIKKYNLLFCLTTLFSYSNTYRFLEFLEYYRSFGVDKFVVYNTNCSKKVKSILFYYSKIGILDIIYDNLTHNLYEKKRFHVWKQNDCFYRYKYAAKRIIFTDHDEIIYSPAYKQTMLYHLNNKAAVYFFYPKLTITHGKGFFEEGNYSICPNMKWKFIINNCNCILQVIVHDVLLKRNRYCYKETIPLNKGYVIHARNEESRHSKVCKGWFFENIKNKEKEKLIKSISNIKYLL